VYEKYEDIFIKKSVTKLIASYIGIGLSRVVCDARHINLA